MTLNREPTPGEVRDDVLDLCRMLATFRRLLNQDVMTEEDRTWCVTTLDVLEADTMLPGELEGDPAAYEALARFRRALRGPGLTDLESAELLHPGGFLAQIEVHLLRVLNHANGERP